ncbi:MAG: methyltransferase domain-containing protein [Nitrospirales bacterium]|nr:methyltransferase domain-containing protein [Nitrospira sp.]MDR4499867.1 methyltransferase domain-containing protein [Nitrospirales bacterium]
MITPTQRLKRGETYWQLLLIIVLLPLLQSCAHGSRNIDSYIQALERGERDEYQKPEEVIAALHIQPGMTIADIGSGSGYFTRRLAKEVGATGKVLATDVEQKMLDYNQKAIDQQGLSGRVTFLRTNPEDPALPPHSIDLIFICNVYHHLKNPSSFLEKAKSALSVNGRVVIIDFYHDERSGKLGFSKHHLVPEETVIKQMQEAGFTLSRRETFLPRQYFLEFVPHPSKS